MIKIALVIVLVLGLSVPAAGAPGSTSKYLMDESVSALDFGIYKMRLDLEEKVTFPDDHDTIFTVEYDWDSDKIKISLYISNNLAKEYKVVKKASSNLIDAYRSFLGIDTDTGKFTQFGKNNYSTMRLFSYFSHEGYSSKSRPEDLIESIAKLIEIEVKMYANPKLKSKSIIDLIGKEGTIQATCKGDLMSTDIWCTE